VQLFAGRLSSCADTTLENDPYEMQQGAFDSLGRAACDASRAGGSAALWANPRFGSFDDVLSSMLVLFEMSTLEGWTDVMWACVDAISPDAAPVRDASPVRAVFHIAWMVLGSVLLLNLFVGVLVNVFAEMKRQEEEGGGAEDSSGSNDQIGVPLMTPLQKEWAESMEALLEIKPKRLATTPDNPLRACCFALVRARWFEGAIMCVIVFNTLLMALDGYGIPESDAATLALLNEVCLRAYACELTPAS
jgi:hypothetical protein